MIQPDRLTVKAAEALQQAASLARSKGNPVVNDAHLFYSLLQQDEGIVVPLLQKASIDYVKNPGPVNQVLIDYTAKIKGGTQITAAGAVDAVQKMTSLGIVGNGSDGVFGSYDMAQVQTLITDYVPVFTARGKNPKAGLQPSDIATNEFLDKTIKL